MASLRLTEANVLVFAHIYVVTFTSEEDIQSLLYYLHCILNYASFQIYIDRPSLLFFSRASQNLSELRVSHDIKIYSDSIRQRACFL